MKNYVARLFLILTFSSVLARAADTPKTRLEILKSFSDEKDYLGLRAFLRRSLKRHLTVQAWTETREFIVEHLSEVGYDMLYSWDKRAPESAETKRVRAVHSYLNYADDLLLKKDFDGAFNNYQKVAASLKDDMDSKNVSRSKSATVLYPYVLDGMGRSLYGMKRYKESSEVFGWIPMSYPRYRRVLFEQMWSSFQAGRVDQTLGRVASQFSSFFSDFHLPEAFLVQAYVYKKLCRTQELAAVIRRMKHLRSDVRRGTFTWRDWLKSDVEGFILTKIIEAKPANPVELVSAEERTAERTLIRESLQRAFETEKPSWLENMETAIAYAQLSTSSASALRPITKLPSRQKLFQLKLEIWPVESGEEWIDEVGSHRFVGESRCGQSGSVVAR